MAADVIRYWAGKERLFRLMTGEAMDLEEALDRQPIAVTFRRLATGAYSLADVQETLRIGLMGGGQSAINAKRLMDNHLERHGLSYAAGIGAELIMALMDGVEEAGGSDDTEPTPMKMSDFAGVCATFSMSPNELRATSYADLMNLLRGYNAAQPDKPIEHISADEFQEILDKYEPQD